MIIPTLTYLDIEKTVDFLTGTLDFTCTSVWPEDEPIFAFLMREGDEVHLGPRRPHEGRSTIVVVCDDVDAQFARFLAAGLVIPDRPESPVHLGPVDQTWGTREFYVDDPSGNTIVYQQRENLTSVA